MDSILSYKKQYNVLNPNFLQTHPFCLKFYAASISMRLDDYPVNLVFLWNKIWSQKFPHLPDPKVLALVCNIFQIFLFC